MFIPPRAAIAVGLFAVGFGCGRAKDEGVPALRTEPPVAVVIPPVAAPPTKQASLVSPPTKRTPFALPDDIAGAATAKLLAPSAPPPARLPLPPRPASSPSATDRGETPWPRAYVAVPTIPPPATTPPKPTPPPERVPDDLGVGSELDPAKVRLPERGK